MHKENKKKKNNPEMQTPCLMNIENKQNLKLGHKWKGHQNP